MKRIRIFYKSITYHKLNKMKILKRLISKIKIEEENAIYALVIVIILISRFAITYLALHEIDKEYGWDMFANDSIVVLPYLALFFVSNLWLAPRLLAKKKVALDVLIAFLLVVATVTISILISPEMPFDEPDFERIERLEKDDFRQTPPPLPKMMDEDFPGEHLLPHGGKRGIERMMSNMLIDAFIAMLIIVLNVSVKHTFRSRQLREHVKQLEHQSVQNELSFLKYQINPHFFMNTLNNIHSLIDIDAELAKDTIIELSHLMRYLLYESSQQLISLDKEIVFIRNFIRIMRIRYPQDVKIDVEMPSDTKSIQLPPLLFLPFVENAFKHGISYRKHSYIDVKMKIEDDTIVFKCTNSIHNTNKVDDKHHGVGLQNIEKRLRLLYGNSYTLHVVKMPDSYEVEMIIPTKYKLPTD